MCKTNSEKSHLLRKLGKAKFVDSEKYYNDSDKMERNFKILKNNFKTTINTIVC